MIKIGVLGVQGNMSSHILRELYLQNIMCSGGTIARPLASQKLTIHDFFPDIPLNSPILDPHELFEESDVVIDFTTPKALLNHLECSMQYKTPLMIGTTGLDTIHIEKIKFTAQSVPLMYSTNTSLGIALMETLSKIIAKNFFSDIHIIETHHKRKKDTPSGTALSLSKALQSIHAHNTNDAPSVNISSIRAGNIVGEHSIIFTSSNERLEFKHTAFHPKLFAQGAVKGALWLHNVLKPRVYDIRDTLSINF